MAALLNTCSSASFVHDVPGVKLAHTIMHTICLPHSTCRPPISTGWMQHHGGRPTTNSPPMLLRAAAAAMSCHSTASPARSGIQACRQCASLARKSRCKLDAAVLQRKQAAAAAHQCCAKCGLCNTACVAGMLSTWPLAHMQHISSGASALWAGCMCAMCTLDECCWQL